MREYLELGSSPIGENCAQVNSDSYYEQSVKECQAYKHQLQRIFSAANFGIKSFPHDFGVYREVVVYYDTEDEKSQETAFSVESNLPEKWDDDARKELTRE